MNLDCVILVGGLGTRLGDLTAKTPKPLLHVNSEPFLKLLMEKASAKGFSRFILLAGYQAMQVEKFANEIRSDRFNIAVSIETSPLGTAGAVRNAQKFIARNFILLNGDSLFLFDWSDLVSVADRNPDAAAVVAMRREEDMSRYGSIVTEGDRISSFEPRGANKPGLINGGVYYFKHNAIQAFPERGSLEKDVFPILAQNRRLFGKEYSGPFIDIGEPNSFLRAQSYLKGL